MTENPASRTSTSSTGDPTGASDRDASAAWAQPVDRLVVGSIPTDAVNLNVSGRRLVGPVQGFGRLWQKTYRLAIPSVDPRAIVATWKAEFGSFWPSGNRFYGPLNGIAPGEVALLNLAVPGGQLLSTGVMVIYADAESFTFMTPEGHMFAAWITGPSSSSNRASEAWTSGSNRSRQRRPSRGSISARPAAVAMVERSRTTARPPSSGWATGASGWTSSTPWAARSIDRKKGEARVSGRIVEQTSCLNPGRVSSSVRVPPPIVPAAS